MQEKECFELITKKPAFSLQAFNGGLGILLLN